MGVQQLAVDTDGYPEIKSANEIKIVTRKSSEFVLKKREKIAFFSILTLAYA